MQFTRKQIIDHLRTSHTATIPELSKSLNLTIGNIRHHIKELVEQNIVEEMGDLPVTQRGRPTKLYRLSLKSLDHNLDMLAGSLLETLIQGETSEEIQNRFNQIASRMIGKFEFSKNLILKLNQAIQWLNQNHYKARWEASASGPRIFLGHCPYLALLDEHPELCQLDEATLSQIVGTPMALFEKFDRDSQSPRHCVFSTKTK